MILLIIGVSATVDRLGNDGLIEGAEVLRRRQVVLYIRAACRRDIAVNRAAGDNVLIVLGHFAIRQDGNGAVFFDVDVVPFIVLPESILCDGQIKCCCLVRILDGDRTLIRRDGVIAAIQSLVFDRLIESDEVLCGGVIMADITIALALRRFRRSDIVIDCAAGHNAHIVCLYLAFRFDGDDIISDGDIVACRVDVIEEIIVQREAEGIGFAVFVFHGDRLVVRLANGVILTVQTVLLNRFIDFGTGRQSRVRSRDFTGIGGDDVIFDLDIRTGFILIDVFRIDFQRESRGRFIRILDVDTIRRDGVRRIIQLIVLDGFVEGDEVLSRGFVLSNIFIAVFTRVDRAEFIIRNLTGDDAEAGIAARDFALLHGDGRRIAGRILRDIDGLATDIFGRQSLDIRFRDSRLDTGNREGGITRVILDFDCAKTDLIAVAVDSAVAIRNFIRLVRNIIRVDLFTGDKAVAAGSDFTDVERRQCVAHVVIDDIVLQGRATGAESFIGKDSLIRGGELVPCRGFAGLGTRRDAGEFPVAHPDFRGVDSRPDLDRAFVAVVADEFAIVYEGVIKVLETRRDAVVFEDVGTAFGLANLFIQEGEIRAGGVSVRDDVLRRDAVGLIVHRAARDDTVVVIIDFAFRIDGDGVGGIVNVDIGSCLVVGAEIVDLERKRSGAVIMHHIDGLIALAERISLVFQIAGLDGIVDIRAGDQVIIVNCHFAGHGGDDAGIGDGNALACRVRSQCASVDSECESFGVVRIQNLNRTVFRRDGVIAAIQSLIHDALAEAFKVLGRGPFFGHICAVLRTELVVRRLTGDNAEAIAFHGPF